ncbi:protein FAM43A-like isoform X2 [Paramacrobiotus metropolitanus]|nr:protein FAM43A-like isoform X2 [Paramacrobiotus metropolitanus]XP_055331388.1 protein FAM43A-like isoform X2 [Paramacrobiotus metropolitanus]
MTFFRRKKSVNITDCDPTYKVVYLGNVLTLVAKGDACVEKPLQTLWKNYTVMQRKDIKMKLTICSSGLKAETTEHGLTEYWAHRITFCGTHPDFPRLFAWVYRHEGKRLKPELRFHAVLCSKADKVQQMASLLQQKILWALNDFKRDKISKQNARRLHEILSEIAPTVCKRRQILSTGQNFRPPLERSKSAPRLVAIEEEAGIIHEEEEEDDASDVNECLNRQSSNGTSSISSSANGVDSTLANEFVGGGDESETDGEEGDDGLYSPSWSVNSSPAGSWNVKRRSSSTGPNSQEGMHNATAFSVHELHKAIEETSSVESRESGFEEIKGHVC